jgi:type VI secretion system secreted protein Hcp
VTEATLTVRKAGQQPLEFLVYKLSDIVVSSYQEAGVAAGDDIPYDSFSINFAKIEVSYKEQNPDGSLGTETKAGWDLKLNKS